MTPPALEEHSLIHTMSKPKIKGHAPKKLDQIHEINWTEALQVCFETAVKEQCSEIEFAPLPMVWPPNTSTLHIQK